VDRIVEGYKPEKVMLFGSYAQGNPTEDSDIDILIVTEKGLSPEETYKVQRQLSKRFSIPIQLICVSDEEFRETKHVIGGITYPAAKYGEVLYEKS
jgi:predicted nucleotidyltransferase